MKTEVSLRCPLAQQTTRRTFFILCFVSSNPTKILLLWKILKKHKRMKNILRPDIALIDGVAISERTINSEMKDSLREEHILLTLGNNT